MKSITIHHIDEPLAELIKSKARSEGLSVNKTIKKILETSFGLKPRGSDTKRSDFEDFCGVWSETDLAEFKKERRNFAKSIQRIGIEQDNPGYHKSFGYSSFCYEQRTINNRPLSAFSLN